LTPSPSQFPHILLTVDVATCHPVAATHLAELALIGALLGSTAAVFKTGFILPSPPSRISCSQRSFFRSVCGYGRLSRSLISIPSSVHFAAHAATFRPATLWSLLGRNHCSSFSVSLLCCDAPLRCPTFRWHCLASPWPRSHPGLPRLCGGWPSSSPCFHTSSMQGLSTSILFFEMIKK